MPDATILPHLAQRFLDATDDPRWWLRWWRERAWVRNQLLRCRRRSYLLTVDALEASSELEDLLQAVGAEEIRA